MELVIEINDDYYNLIKRDADNGDYLNVLERAVINGTPLPKGHGRLIDAERFEKDNKELWGCDFIHPKYEDTLEDLITDAPTIIEADRSEE